MCDVLHKTGPLWGVPAPAGTDQDLGTNQEPSLPSAPERRSDFQRSSSRIWQQPLPDRLFPHPLQFRPTQGPADQCVPPFQSDSKSHGLACRFCLLFCWILSSLESRLPGYAYDETSMPEIGKLTPCAIVVVATSALRWPLSSNHSIRFLISSGRPAW